MTATITDNNGLPIQGQLVKFSSTGHCKIPPMPPLADAQGKATTEVTG
ncbi:MAG: Ig-like domain-containing protein [Thiotrichaceae bacterium]